MFKKVARQGSLRALQGMWHPLQPLTSDPSLPHTPPVCPYTRIYPRNFPRQVIRENFKCIVKFQKVYADVFFFVITLQPRVE